MTAPGAKQKTFTAEEVRMIRDVRDIASCGKLAHKLGKHRMTIYRIWNGETYRKVPNAAKADAGVRA